MKILLVEDDFALAMGTEFALQAEGYEVIKAKDVSEDSPAKDQTSESEKAATTDGTTEEKTEETNSIDELDKTEEGEFSLPITGPITGDNIIIWVSIFGISFIALIIVRKIED